MLCQLNSTNAHALQSYWLPLQGLPNWKGVGKGLEGGKMCRCYPSSSTFEGQSEGKGRIVRRVASNESWRFWPRPRRGRWRRFASRWSSRGGLAIQRGIHRCKRAIREREREQTGGGLGMLRMEVAGVRKVGKKVFADEGFKQTSSLASRRNVDSRYGALIVNKRPSCV